MHVLYLGLIIIVSALGDGELNDLRNGCQCERI